MIKHKEYKDWENNDKSKKFGLIAVLYNPKLKQKTLTNGYFILENKNSNNRKLIDLIKVVCKKYIGEKYEAYLFDRNSSWIKKHDLLSLKLQTFKSKIPKIQEYLIFNGIKKNNYKGSMKIHDIKSFLSLFIDYPKSILKQPIELYSLESDFLIVISDHGTIWIVSKDKYTLVNISKFLDKNGATVIFSNTF